MDNHTLMQQHHTMLQQQQQNQQQLLLRHQQHQLQQLQQQQQHVTPSIGDNNSAAMPVASTFVTLLKQDIPECRYNLRENHVNLQRLGDYCKVNYLQKNDRDLALEETKQFAQQALASVAYQLNAYAFNLTQLFDYQHSQITDMEGDVRYLTHMVTMHREKIARREIGILTTNKVIKKDIKIVAPMQPERVQRYHRQRIDYNVFDDIGHGVRSGAGFGIKQQGSTAPSSSGGGYAHGSVAMRNQPPQHRDSISSSSSNASPLPWTPMMPFEDTLTARHTGTLGRHGGRTHMGEYRGVVQVPPQILQQQQRYPNTSQLQDNNSSAAQLSNNSTADGNYPAAAIAAATYQRSVSNVSDMQHPRISHNNLNASNSTTDPYNNSSGFPQPHLQNMQQQQQQQQQQLYNQQMQQQAYILPTGRVDYSDATLLPPHRRGGNNQNNNNNNNINSSASVAYGGMPSSANPYLTLLAEQQYGNNSSSPAAFHQAMQQQQQHIMPPPPLQIGDATVGGIVQSHYATQRQVFAHMPEAAFGTLHHQHRQTTANKNIGNNSDVVNGNGMGNYQMQQHSYMPVGSAAQQQHQNQQYHYNNTQNSQDTLVGNSSVDGYASTASVGTSSNNGSSGSSMNYANSNSHSDATVPPSSIMPNSDNNNNYMLNKHIDVINQNFVAHNLSQMPLSMNGPDPYRSAQQFQNSLRGTGNELSDQNNNNTLIMPSSLAHPSGTNAVPRLYLEKVVAIYDYTRMQPDELEFKEGQVIFVLKKNEDGWYEGVLDGVRGLFPGNYVETIAMGPMSTAPPPPLPAGAVNISKYNGNLTGGGQTVYQ